MNTAIKHLRKWLCVQCFNALPEKERGGRGAIEAGWVPEGTPKVKCSCCNKECVGDSESGSRF